MKRKLLIIASFLCFGLAVKAQWIQQDPQLTGPSNVLNVFNVSAVNGNVAWASLHGLGASPAPVQKYLRTVDGGATWVLDSVDGASGHDFGNLFALNADTAWAAMYANTGGGALFRTFDGGANWVKATTTEFSNAASFPNVVYFFDSNNGFAMGDPINGYFEIYTTTDAGTTWTRVPTGNIAPELSGEYGIVNLYSAVGDTVWFGTNKGRVYKSTNKGMNWTVAATGLKYINDVVFSDGMNGYATQNDTLKVTGDGGLTWTQVNKKGKFYAGDDLAYVPNSGTPGVLVSSGVFRPSPGAKFQYGSSFSKDGGVTWYDLTDPNDSLSHNGIAFVDSTNGFSGGFHHIAVDTNIVDKVIMFRWNGGFVIPSNLSYTITASNGPNGTIAPAGTVNAAYGSDQAFVITPDPGYLIDSLIVNGVKVVSTPTYTFTNVVRNHTIRATFIPSTFTIQASSGPNGSITPSGAVTVNTGTNQTFTITPNSGYVLDSLIVNGIKRTNAGSYTFTNVRANHTIRVVFKSTVGINEAKKAESIVSLYPNPAQNLVNLKLGDMQKNLNIQIFDISGRKVKGFSLDSNESTVTLDINDLQAGSYFIEISDGKSKGISKFTKE